MASTSAVAMRAIDEPITRAICNARPASSAPSWMNSTTLPSISTSGWVNTRSPGRGSGKPSARQKARITPGSTPERAAT